MLVKDVMRKEVLSFSPDDDVVSAGKTMLEKRASCAVVLDSSGKLLGLLSKESFVLSVKYLGGNPLGEFRVRDFMNQNVETVRPDDLLKDAIVTLLGVPYRIDRLPVVEDDGDIVGILTKGCIVQLFADQVKRRFKVKDLMRFDSTVVCDYTPIRDVLKAIDSSKEKRVLVLRGKELVGILTILDLSVAFFRERLRKGGVFDWDIYSDMTAEEVMTNDPVTVESKKDANHAANIMVEKRIGGIPVVDRELVGLISKTEIVKGYNIFLEQG